MGARGVDPALVDFLIQIEDKLDRILDLLLRHETQEQTVFVGEGLDIGGGGMSIRCDRKVKVGQILDVAFRVFRYPPVSLRIFGKVVRVESLRKDGDDNYHVALEYIDLGEADKEWIISYVFQVQREAIRSKKVH